MSEFPRAMSDAERAMLDFMLAVDDARIAPLRVQADHARVVSLCGCGCATINLVVERVAAPVAPGLPYAVVDASRRRPLADDDCYDMIVFARDGWLSSLEVVWYREPIAVLPDPATLTQPTVTDSRGIA